eukprot:1583746-Rhodomonas_salina.2
MSSSPWEVGSFHLGPSSLIKTRFLAPFMMALMVKLQYLSPVTKLYLSEDHGRVYPLELLYVVHQ